MRKIIIALAMTLAVMPAHSRELTCLERVKCCDDSGVCGCKPTKTVPNPFYIKLRDAISQYDVGATIQDDDVPKWNAIVKANRDLGKSLHAR